MTSSELNFKTFTYPFIPTLIINSIKLINHLYEISVLHGPLDLKEINYTHGKYHHFTHITSLLGIYSFEHLMRTNLFIPRKRYWWKPKTKLTTFLWCSHLQDIVLSLKLKHWKNMIIMFPKSFGKSNIYSYLEHYTDVLFLRGHLSKNFRDHFFNLILLYRDRSSFLTQIIAFIQPRNE